MVTLSRRVPDLPKGYVKWKYLNKEQHPSKISARNWRRVSYEAAHIGALREFVGDDRRPSGDEVWRCGICFNEVIFDDRTDQRKGLDGILKTSCSPTPHFFHNRCIRDDYASRVDKSCLICRTEVAFDVAFWHILADSMREMSQKTKNDLLCVKAMQGTLSRWDLGFIEMLLRTGASVLDHNHEGFNAVHCAAMSGHADVLQKLLTYSDLETGLNVKARVEGLTPLHLAVATDQSKEAARLLINYGADPNARAEDGHTPLHIVAFKKNRELLFKMLDAGADLNQRDDRGRATLHFAIMQTRGLNRQRAKYERTVDFIDRILDYRVDIHVSDNEGLTPLHIAALENCQPIAAKLIRLGSDVHAKNFEGQTPLHLSVKARANLVTDTLLGHGAEVESKDSDGNTCMHYAAAYGDEETVLALYRPHLDLNQENDNGDTPMTLAIRFDNDATLEVVVVSLLEGNYDPNAGIRLAAEKGSTHTLTWFLRNAVGYDIDSTNPQGETALHLAAKNENREAVWALCEAGANLYAKDHMGYTPLHLAASHNSTAKVATLLVHGLYDPFGEREPIERRADIFAESNVGTRPIHCAQRNTKTTEIFNFLQQAEVDHGVDKISMAVYSVDTKRVFEEAKGSPHLNSFSSIGDNPLFKSIDLDLPNITRALIQAGARVDQLDPGGDTALLIAARMDKLEAARVLIDHGAALDHINDYGFSPLAAASYNGHQEMVQLLLQSGANVEEATPSGITPLHHAVRGGSATIVASLLDAEADVEAIGLFGVTPLMIAAMNGRDDLVRELCMRGASLESKTLDHSKTPLHIAMTNGHIRAAETLLRFGADLNAVDSTGNTPMDSVPASIAEEMQLMVDRHRSREACFDLASKAGAVFAATFAGLAIHSRLAG